MNVAETIIVCFSEVITGTDVTILMKHETNYSGRD
jgi:hypothetical protein